MENGLNAACEITNKAHKNGLLKYRARLESNQCKADIRTAIDCLAPAPATRDTLLAIFNFRATYGAIQHWRFGRAVPPQWAIRLLVQRLEERAAPSLRAAANLKHARGPGKGWNKGAKTLAVWRERKARERDAKEKAASEAASNELKANQ